SPLPQPPPSSTPSPYTTLFRSKTHQPFTRRGAGKTGSSKGTWLGINQTKHIAEAVGNHHPQLNAQMVSKGLCQFQFVTGRAAARSEEHTSELQSRENLVCRLLL